MRIEWLNELFDFSRKDRNGILILLCVIFILLVLRITLPWLIPDRKVDFSAWNAEVDQFLITQQIQRADSSHMAPFDPNKVDSVTLLQVGVPIRVVGFWLNYRRKGGVFRDLASIRRIYGMSPMIVDKFQGLLLFEKPVAPQLKIKKDDEKTSHTAIVKDKSPFDHYVSKSKPRLASLEINGADSLSLIQIPGIGSVLASRIIRYRKLLGGYYGIDQLREVYGLRPTNFETLSPYLTIDRSLFLIFNVNLSTFQELCHHPYIGYKLAKKIIRFRDHNGKFSYVNDLSSLVGADSLSRLRPYLRFSD